jgi:23S rRNA (adenine2503-C2)-methyltransferase
MEANQTAPLLPVVGQRPGGTVRPSASARLPVILGMSSARLSRYLPELDLAEARRVVAAVHRGDTLAGPVAQVRRTTLELLRARTTHARLELVREERSRIDPFVKLALRTGDGHLVEAVRIPLERQGRFSACVSSQVGCALGCRFCATGTLGLSRNLEPWEMVAQVHELRSSIVRDGSSGRIHGVVFQGMGEPLANFDAVLQTIEVLSEPSALAIDARNITVSTSGLPTGISRLARELPKVRLALSLHAARSSVRAELLPIERAHDLGTVIDASVEHAQLTGLAPLWAITLLQGQNDSEDDAHALADLALAFKTRAGKGPRISLIPYNHVPELLFERTLPEVFEAFRTVLRARGVGSHVRYSGGSDVAAACGQLAAES